MSILTYQDLTDEQRGAVTAIVGWYKSRLKKIFILAGYAGTGKSSTMPFVAGELNLSEDAIRYCTFTGKAALVLIQKGIRASTIHSLIYEVRKGPYGTPKFVKKKSLDEGIKLIVIDEYSMISNQIMEDLLTFDIPILMFGDPGQLPPIGQPNTYVTKPDILLNKIHRQAEGNEILTLSYKLRTGERMQPYDGKQLKIKRKKDFDSADAFNADQVICSTNATRHHFNKQMRKGLGREGDPVVGDKIICLKNNWELCIDDMFFLVNGMIGTIEDLGVNKFFDPTLDFKPDFLDSIYSDVLYEDRIFKGIEVPYDPNAWKSKKKINEFDYAYAITAHKSQGSEYKKVMWWEEVLRMDMHKFLAYTVATRAGEELTAYID